MPIINSADILVIGAGPAGYTAGLYGSRAGRQTILLDKGIGGGQLATTFRIENYPGVSGGISGFELAETMKEQALHFGAQVDQTEVLSLRKEQELFQVETTNGTYQAQTIILATGASPRKLKVPGEEGLIGKGISFCATCDGAFFRDKKVAIVGGGNSAVEEALFLTRFAAEVAIIHRRDELRADKIIQEEALANPKISFHYNYVVTQVMGDNKVSGLMLQSTVDQSEKYLPIDGVFVYIGNIPNSQIVKGLVNMDEKGFIITGEDLMTSLPGLFAAGDIRQKALRQVITACADGATAATAADLYLSRKGV